MSIRVLTGGALAALAGAAMLAISASSASAFTLPSPSLEHPMASSQVDHVWYYHHFGGWGWHRHWGWGGGPVIVPAPSCYSHRVCWTGYYGHLHCRWVCD